MRTTYTLRIVDASGYLHRVRTDCPSIDEALAYFDPKLVDEVWVGEGMLELNDVRTGALAGRIHPTEDVTA